MIEVYTVSHSFESIFACSFPVLVDVNKAAVILGNDSTTNAITSTAPPSTRESAMATPDRTLTETSLSRYDLNARLTVTDDSR